MSEILIIVSVISIVIVIAVANSVIADYRHRNKTLSQIVFDQNAEKIWLARQIDLCHKYTEHPTKDLGPNYWIARASQETADG